MPPWHLIRLEMEYHTPKKKKKEKNGYLVLWTNSDWETISCKKQRDQNSVVTNTESLIWLEGCALSVGSYVNDDAGMLCGRDDETVVSNLFCHYCCMYLATESDESVSQQTAVCGSAPDSSTQSSAHTFVMDNLRDTKGPGAIVSCRQHLDYCAHSTARKTNATTSSVIITKSMGPANCVWRDQLIGMYSL